MQFWQATTNSQKKQRRMYLRKWVGVGGCRVGWVPGRGRQWASDLRTADRARGLTQRAGEESDTSPAAVGESWQEGNGAKLLIDGKATQENLHMIQEDPSRGK